VDERSTRDKGSCPLFYYHHRTRWDDGAAKQQQHLKARRAPAAGRTER
jgi:hypothetical protein